MIISVMITQNRPLAGGQVRGRPGLFSLFRRLTRVNLLYLVLVTQLPAYTLTNSSSGASASITVSWNPSTGKLDYSFVCVANGTGIGGNTAPVTRSAAVQIYATTGDGGSAGTLLVSGTNASNSNTGVGSGDLSAALGNWYILYAYTTAYPGGGSPLPTNYGKTYYQLEASYYADFRIPENKGDQVVKVKFYQNGVLLTTLNVAPGAEAQTLHLSSGVTGGQLVTAVYSYGNYVQLDGGSIVFEPDKEFEHAGGGMPVTDAEPPEPYQLLPMRAIYGITPEDEPLEPTPEVTPQNAPTPVAAPSNPTPVSAPTRNPLGIPYGTPAGGDPVKKEDLQDAANKLADALDKADDNRKKSDDKTLEALNNSTQKAKESADANLSALNSLRSELIAGGNKQVDAINKSNTAIDGLKAELRSTNGRLDTVAATLGQIELNNRPPDAGTGDAFMQTLKALAEDARDTAVEAADVKPPQGTVREDNLSGPAAEWMIQIPFTDLAVNVNPLAQPKILFLAELCRVCIGWFVVLSLVSWTYIQIPKWYTEGMKGATGITSWKAITGALPGVGAAILFGLWALMGTIMLTSPTLLRAATDPYLMDQSAFALIDIRDAFEAAGAATGESSTVEKMIGLIDACCPTGLVMQAFFNWVFLQIAGQAIVAGVLALQKLLNSG